LCGGIAVHRAFAVRAHPDLLALLAAVHIRAEHDIVVARFTLAKTLDVKEGGEECAESRGWSSHDTGGTDLRKIRIDQPFLALLGVNEAFRVAAGIAEEENSPIAASRIRCLKWAYRTIAPNVMCAFMPVARERR
jgi:hypothetical protein